MQNKDIVSFLEHFEFSESPKPQFRTRNKLEDFILNFNGFSDVVASLFHSISFKNQIDSNVLLDTIQNNLLTEKSDAFKQEYLHFIVENLAFFGKDIAKLTEFVQFLLGVFKENYFANNPFFKCNLIRTLTNIIIFLEIAQGQDMLNSFHEILIECIFDHHHQNRFVKSMAIQSLNELESFYPGWLESELYSRSNYENANPSNDFISFPSNSNFSSVHRFNSSLLQQLPSFKTFSALNQTEAAKSQSLMELYRREKTQCFADLLILILEISLNAVKKQVFQPETLKSANYEKLNSENLTGRLLNNEVSIPQKLQDLIKKIISHIISDMNLVSYFSKTLVLDYLTVFLNITKMSSKVILPLYSNMLKFQGSCHVLCNLLILKRYNSDLDEQGKHHLIQRLFYDITAESLNNLDRTLLIYWIVNLGQFTSDGELRQINFHSILMKNFWNLLPKPSDNYLLKEKKIMAFLKFCEASDSDQVDPGKIIGILLNFQIFKQFSVLSDITSTFFRIFFACVRTFAFASHLEVLVGYLFEVLQHKPKFSANAIELFRRLSGHCQKSENQELKLKAREIYQYFLKGFSKFLLKIEPATKISLYFDLIRFVIDEPLIDCEQILNSVLRLAKAVNESFAVGDFYKINENIMFVCKRTLKSNKFEGIANILLEIFGFLARKSPDIAVKDSATIYHFLLENLKSHKLNKIFFKGNIDQANPPVFAYHQIEKIYHFNEFNSFSDNIFLKCSLEERRELGIFDNACAIFGQFEEDNCRKPDQMYSKFFEFLGLRKFSNEFILFKKKREKRLFDVETRDIMRVVSDGTREKEIEATSKLGLENLESNILKKYLKNLRVTRFVKLKDLDKFLKEKRNLYLNFQVEILVYLKNAIFNQYIEEVNKKPPTIIVPLNLSSKQIQLYSLLILFAKSTNYQDIPTVFVPFLDLTSKLSYKILLKLKVKNPIPINIGTGYFFTLSSEKICLSNGAKIELKFEDMFLPVELTLAFKDRLNQITHNQFLIEDIFDETLIKLCIFEGFWNSQCVEAAKIINNTKNNIIQLMESKLKHFWIHEPGEGKMPNIIKIFAGFYNEEENFDFEFERNSDKNSKGWEEILNCPVMILLPEKYFLCMKISIHEKCSLIRMKTNKKEIFKQIDKYFDSWIQRDK